MTKASDNEFPSVLFDEQPSNVSTPASGFWRAFFKSDGLYVIDDAGAVTGPLAAGSSLPSLAHGKVTRNNVGSNVTISSTTWADIDSTNLTITMTTGARRVLLLLTGRVSQSGANITRYGFTVDSTALLTESTGSTGNGITKHDTSSEGATIVAITGVLTAGSHTFRPRWNCSAGTSTLQQTASTDWVVFEATELLNDT